MGRVRTREEVEEIKLREKIKLSLVRQQIDLNRMIGHGGCATGRGKVYITSIFQKNGLLSITRPHLCLECAIRSHLNLKDTRMRRRPMYDPRLVEDEIREFCGTRTYKDRCPAYRRFLEETDSIIVKRELPGGTKPLIEPTYENEDDVEQIEVIRSAPEAEPPQSQQGPEAPPSRSPSDAEPPPKPEKP